MANQKSQQTDQATKRPWVVSSGALITDGKVIIANCLALETGLVPDLLIESEANASLIVKCVNGYDKLEEALRDIISRSEGDDVFMASDISNLAKFAIRQND